MPSSAVEILECTAKKKFIDARVGTMVVGQRFRCNRLDAVRLRSLGLAEIKGEPEHPGLAGGEEKPSPASPAAQASRATKSGTSAKRGKKAGAGSSSSTTTGD